MGVGDTNYVDGENISIIVVHELDGSIDVEVSALPNPLLRDPGIVDPLFLTADDAGVHYFNTADGKYRFWTGTAWEEMTSTSSTTRVAPTITAITPMDGETGDSIVIAGTGFTPATDVLINGVSATSFTVDSDIQITFVLDGTSTNGLVGVVTPYGTAEAGIFKHIYVPVLTSVAPDAGFVGATVVITGTGLENATSIDFNGTAAVTYTIDSPTQITVVVPVGATTGDITVTTSAGSDTIAFLVRAAVGSGSTYETAAYAVAVDPTSYWRMDDPSGNLYDLGLHKDLVITGGGADTHLVSTGLTGAPTAWRSGGSGARLFTAGALPNVTADQCSIAGWYKDYAAPNGSDNDWYVGMGYSGGHVDPYYIMAVQVNGGSPGWTISVDHSAAFSFDGPVGSLPATGVWRHMALVYTGTHKELWIDGVKVVDIAQTGNVRTMSGLALLDSYNIPGTQHEHDTGLSNWAYWKNYALTPTDIANLIAAA